MATDQFYQRIAAKDYQAIYRDAAPEFRGSMSPDLFVGMMERIDRRLGACKAPVKIMNWHVNATTNGYFRDQGYSRACANGPLQETVTIVVRNASPAVARVFTITGMADMFGLSSD